MARRADQITGVPRWPGEFVAGLVLVLCIGPLVALWMRGERGGLWSAAHWPIVVFTVKQALLSALLSVVLAIPLARALARSQFRGRGLLITLLGAPFILPVIVAVLGLIAVFGRGGWINAGLTALGLPTISIYGLEGIVMAHVFLNLPLATRLILQGWLAIPSERFRLAATLNASIGGLLEWPMLRAVVPRLFVVIFFICLSSFAVALTLGGGPASTTIELALYQAIRFEADFGGAAELAALQFSICALAGGLALILTVPTQFGGGLDRAVRRWDGGRGTLWLDRAMIGVAVLFLLMPMIAVILRGAAGLFEMPPTIWAAALRSVLVAAAAMILALALALPVALRGGIAGTIAFSAPFAISGLVMGTGLFIILFEFTNPATLSLPITVLVNAMMCLPFVVPQLTAAVQDVQASYGRLSDQLGLTGWARMRIVILPRLRRPLGFAAGLAAALSMGDLGVIALFATPDQETLPLAMYRLMGSYRTEGAAGAALLLLTLSLGMFWLCDRGGRANAAT